MKAFRMFLAAVGVCALVGGSPTTSLAVNECCIQGVGCFSSSGFPYDEDICPGDDVCGCTLYGTNCQFELNDDFTTASSGDCFTIGKGVTLDMKGHTIECTGSDCGRGILGTSFFGTGTRTISDGFVKGCFDIGIFPDGSTTTTLDGMYVELGACTNGITVGGVANRSIGFLGGNTITNSQVHNTEWGMWVDGDLSAVVFGHNDVGLRSSGGNDVQGALFYDNDVHIEEAGGSDIDVYTASFVGAVNCNRSVSGTCQADLEGGHVVLKGTDPILVCEPSGDATKLCTIR